MVSATAIIRNLYEIDADGDSLDQLQTVLEFSIQPTEQTDSVEIEMDEAVVQANVALERMSSMSAFLTHVKDGVDSAQAVFGGVKPIAQTWEPFLNKIELFVKLVDEFSEVRRKIET